MDLDKVQAMVGALAPHSAKVLSRFLGQIKWHYLMIGHLADFVTPLHSVVHREPLRWTEEEDKAFVALKLFLS
jgi:hypothetical protein